MHVGTPEIDRGPAVLRSWPFAIAPWIDEVRRWRRPDIIRAYAFAHQEWMIRATWGPLLGAALGLMAGGRVTRRGDAACVDGAPGPIDLRPPEAVPAPCTLRRAGRGVGIQTIDAARTGLAL